MGSSGSSVVKNPFAGDPGLIRREGNGCPLQYCLENSMDRRAWQATVRRVAKSWTWLEPLTQLTLGSLRWSRKMWLGEAEFGRPSRLTVKSLSQVCKPAFLWFHLDCSQIPLLVMVGSQRCLLWRCVGCESLFPGYLLGTLHLLLFLWEAVLVQVGLKVGRRGLVFPWAPFSLHVNSVRPLWTSTVVLEQNVELSLCSPLVLKFWKVTEYS